MKNLKKKLLTITCVIGMMGLGYALPAKAFESKISTDSPVAETTTRESTFLVDNYGVDVEVKGTTTVKTLENGVKITEIDYGLDGKIDYMQFDQELPSGGLIIEVDKNVDGDIDYRATINTDGSLFVEKQLSDGSVEKTQIKAKRY